MKTDERIQRFFFSGRVPVNVAQCPWKKGNAVCCCGRFDVEDRRTFSFCFESHFSKRNSGGITHDKRTFAVKDIVGIRGRWKMASSMTRISPTKGGTPRLGGVFVGQKTRPSSKGERAESNAFIASVKNSFPFRFTPLACATCFLAICNVNAIHE